MLRFLIVFNWRLPSVVPQVQNGAELVCDECVNQCSFEANARSKQFEHPFDSNVFLVQYGYMEIWPTAFRSYNLMVPNFFNIPLPLNKAAL